MPSLLDLRKILTISKTSIFFIKNVKKDDRFKLYIIFVV